MSEDLTYLTSHLIASGILPETIKTSDAVKMLNNPKYHRRKLYQLREQLNGKRTGSGKHFVFDTKKIIQLMMRD